MNNKKLTALICAMLCAVSLCGCGKQATEKGSQISGDGTDSAKVSQLTDANPADPADPNATPVPTMPPVATQAPEAVKKAEEKAASTDNNANVTIDDGSGNAHQVSLKFAVTNNTGINFVKFLIVPAGIDIKAGQNVLPENFIFSNGQSLELDPGASTTLDSPMFNFAGITEDGKGYIFPNIDLAANSVVELQLENGVPKAIMQ